MCSSRSVGHKGVAVTKSECFQTVEILKHDKVLIGFQCCPFISSLKNLLSVVNEVLIFDKFGNSEPCCESLEEPSVLKCKIGRKALKNRGTA